MSVAAVVFFGDLLKGALGRAAVHVLGSVSPVAGGSLEQLSQLQPPADRKMNKNVVRMQNLKQKQPNHKNSTKAKTQPSCVTIDGIHET